MIFYAFLVRVQEDKFIFFVTSERATSRRQKVPPWTFSELTFQYFEKIEAPPQKKLFTEMIFI